MYNRILSISKRGQAKTKRGAKPLPCSRPPERNPDKSSHLSLYQVLSQHFVTYVTKMSISLTLYTFGLMQDHIAS